MKDLEYYMNLDYLTIVLLDQCTDETYSYLARHPELPGCLADGKTHEEAIENLFEARHLYISDMLSRGMEPPEPWSLNRASEMIISSEQLIYHEPEPAIPDHELDKRYQEQEPELVYA